jgi:NTP pyrophosphatase (non-canonical NTP hydrolase)
MREEQERVERFIEEHDLAVSPAFRILDLVAEVGEIASESVKSSDYGAKDDGVSVSRSEIGDALFALLAVASRLDVDAEEAFAEALDKYRDRMSDSGSPGSDSP